MNQNDKGSKQPLLDEKLDQYVIIAVVPAVGDKAVNGLSNKYDVNLPKSLLGIVPENEFRVAMMAINRTAKDFFPCAFCRIIGYLCCLITFGLSLCCLDNCTDEMESNVQAIIRRINRKDIFLYKGIQWRLRRNTFSSWIEVVQLKYGNETTV